LSKGTTWGAAYLQVCRQPRVLLAGDQLVLETYQDLRVNPRYSFSTTLVRGGRREDLGTHRIRW
jgi:hypothetical protein